MSTTYDALIINSDGTGPVRHQFTTITARDEFLTTHDPLDYILQTVDNLTGEILDEKETGEPGDSRHNAETETSTDETPAENPIYDTLQGR